MKILKKLHLCKEIPVHCTGGNNELENLKKTELLYFYVFTVSPRPTGTDSQYWYFMNHQYYYGQYSLPIQPIILNFRFYSLLLQHTSLELPPKQRLKSKEQKLTKLQFPHVEIVIKSQHVEWGGEGDCELIYCERWLRSENYLAGWTFDWPLPFTDPQRINLSALTIKETLWSLSRMDFAFTHPLRIRQTKNHI